MRTLLLLAALFFAPTLRAQKTDTTGYRCLPCGYDCDRELYRSSGTCTHCKMQLVAASTIRFTEVSPATVCDYIRKHPGALLLDVRTEAEYEGRTEPYFSRIKGSVNIPLQELSQRLAELEKYKEREVLVICSHSHRSPQAAYLLGQQGFKKVANLSGGLSVVTDAACKD
jgi:rhodanese-related sulfurtransferase